MDVQEKVRLGLANGAGLYVFRYVLGCTVTTAAMCN